MDIQSLVAPVFTVLALFQDEILDNALATIMKCIKGQGFQCLALTGVAADARKPPVWQPVFALQGMIEYFIVLYHFIRQQPYHGYIVVPAFIQDISGIVNGLFTSLYTDHTDEIGNALLAVIKADDEIFKSIVERLTQLVLGDTGGVIQKQIANLITLNVPKDLTALPTGSVPPNALPGSLSLEGLNPQNLMQKNLIQNNAIPSTIFSQAPNLQNPQAKENAPKDTEPQSLFPQNLISQGLAGVTPGSQISETENKTSQPAASPAAVPPNVSAQSSSLPSTKPHNDASQSSGVQSNTSQNTAPQADTQQNLAPPSVPDASSDSSNPMLQSLQTFGVQPQSGETKAATPQDATPSSNPAPPSDPSPNASTPPSAPTPNADSSNPMLQSLQALSGQPQSDEIKAVAQQNPAPSNDPAAPSASAPPSAPTPPSAPAPPSAPTPGKKPSNLKIQQFMDLKPQKPAAGASSTSSQMPSANTALNPITSAMSGIGMSNPLASIPANPLSSGVNAASTVSASLASGGGIIQPLTAAVQTTADVATGAVTGAVEGMKSEGVTGSVTGAVTGAVQPVSDAVTKATSSNNPDEAASGTTSQPSKGMEGVPTSNPVAGITGALSGLADSVQSGLESMKPVGAGDIANPQTVNNNLSQTAAKDPLAAVSGIASGLSAAAASASSVGDISAAVTGAQADLLGSATAALQANLPIPSIAQGMSADAFKSAAPGADPTASITAAQGSSLLSSLNPANLSLPELPHPDIASNITEPLMGLFVTQINRTITSSGVMTLIETQVTNLMNTFIIDPVTKTTISVLCSVFLMGLPSSAFIYVLPILLVTWFLWPFYALYFAYCIYRLPSTMGKQVGVCAKAQLDGCYESFQKGILAQVLAEITQGEQFVQSLAGMKEVEDLFTGFASKGESLLGL